MYKNFKDDIIKIAKANPQQESCGLIYLDKNKNPKVVECENIHDDPENFFKIKSEDYIFLEENYETLATFHSHPTSAAIPTEFDVLQADELGLPMYIYSLPEDSFYVYRPSMSHKKKILGRTFVPDLQNCLTCVIDFYLQKYNLDYPDKINWVETKDVKEGNGVALNAIMGLSNDSIEVRQIDKKDLDVNDLIVIKTLKSHYYHSGVLVNPNQVIHHSMHSICSIESLDSRWMNFVTKVFRVSAL
jgi:proteasome lid subunit RPN8/RPN11